MANWWKNVKKVNYSRKYKRFLTSFDMSEAKRMEAILNSRIKRGDIERKFGQYMSVCSCGVSGCIIVGQHD